jgi:5-methyltetrahydropteroyltriglutamate--homocysteine methyltransferase
MTTRPQGPTGAEPRAEIVGSLLRAPEVREARRGLAEKTVTQAELRAIENAAVLDAIALQERCGIDVVADGELRRDSWVPTVHALHGFEMVLGGPGWQWKGSDRAESHSKRPYPAVTEKISVAHDLAQEEYAFLHEHASGRTKHCIPAPSYHRTFWDPDHSKGAYATPEEFLVAVRDYIRSLVKDLVALGCDYVQLDAPNYGFICDPAFREEMTQTGRDLAADIRFDAELDSSVFEGLDGVTTAIHLCRGNSAGMWAASGGYEAVAADLFPNLHVDRLLLEYDTPRSGDFGALEHVPDDQVVVLGLLTTKDGELEDEARVEVRIHEAERFVPLERLALSPQCGFASVASGNPLTVEQQEAKLRLVGDVAHRVWA